MAGNSRKKPASGRGSRTPEAQEAKRQRRLERQRQEAAARHRAARRAQARRVAFAVVALLVVGIGGYLLLRPDPELADVERLSSQGQGHVAATQYDTNTPTSGDHPLQAPACRSYSQPLAPGLAVHALEHGAVLVWYDAGRADELRPELEAIADRWDSHVVLSPNTALDAPIVATAWNRRARYEEAGDDVAAFIETYRRRGPERQSCPT